MNLLKKFSSRDEVPVEPVSVSEPVPVNLVSQVDSKRCVSSVNVYDDSLSRLDHVFMRFAEVFAEVPRER